MSANPFVINLTVSWEEVPNPDGPPTWIPAVSDPKPQVTTSSGDLVVITWAPGVPDLVITSITGFPSAVAVAGPDANGTWMASYQQTASQCRWSYIVSAASPTGTVIRHDPEIDNTPPPPLP